MKKSLSLLLVVLLAWSLAACGSGSTAGTGSPANTAGGEDPPRVAVILDKLGDAGITDATYSGYERAVAELPITGRYIEQSSDPSKYRAMVVEACETSDIVVATAGNGLVDEIITAAAEYPDVQFMVLDCALDQEGIDLPNFLGIMCSQSEVSYLAGYLGMRMSGTGKIGVVVGVEYPTLSDFIVGYISGAVQANPEAQVAVSASGDWTDQGAAKETALAQIQLGVDCVYAVGAASSFGTLEACKEAGAWGIGCDTDLASQFIGIDDEQADVIITSAYKDWGQAAYSFIERCITDPTRIPWGTVEVVGLAGGGIKLIKNEIYEKQVPAEIRREIEELEDKIISGEIVCPSYFTMTQAEYDALKEQTKLR